MKTIAVVIALLVSSIALGQDLKKGSIKVNVPNVHGTEGNVAFGLYTENTFMKNKPDYGVVAEIKDGTATAVFNEIPEGTYALIVMHDANGNKQMDFENNGMPKEEYGTSGTINLYGPPQWEESKFDFDGTEKSMEIRF